MELADNLSEVEDLRRAIKTIRLICDENPGETLCDEGLEMKKQIIFQIDFLGERRPITDEEINLKETITKAQFWDRALELADEGKMMKSMEKQIHELKERITVLKTSKGD
jgi:hypothetical protein